MNAAIPDEDCAANCKDAVDCKQLANPSLAPKRFARHKYLTTDAPRLSAGFWSSIRSPCPTASQPYVQRRSHSHQATVIKPRTQTCQDDRRMQKAQHNQSHRAYSKSETASNRLTYDDESWHDFGVFFDQLFVVLCQSSSFPCPLSLRMLRVR
jgi:hypothetical protein